MDSNYKVIDLKENVKAMDSPSKDQKKQLITTLKKFLALFSGRLGTINIKYMYLEPKEVLKVYER